MKKIVSLIIVLNLLLTGLPVFAGNFSDVTDSKIIDSVEKLTALEIIMGYEDGTFKPDNNITRAEFMTIVARILGVSSIMQGEFTEDIFNDVSKDHWAAGYIKYGVDNKMISGYGNGNFGPNDNVTYEQAFKIIYNAMSYDVIADEKGGYPDGYVNLALEHGITKGMSVDFKSSATRGNIAYILDKVMDVNILERSSFGGEKSNYVRTDKTLLSNLLTIKNGTIRKGIVVANQYTNIENSEALSENHIMIKDSNGLLTVYEVENPFFSDYLGYNVEFYANISEDISTPIVTKIVPDVNEEFTLNAKDIDDVIDGSNIKIVYEEGNKSKDLTFDRNIKTVYNNRYTQTNYNDFDITNGSVKFVDNDKDGKYEVAFINEYFSFMVDSVSSYTNTVFIKDATYRGLKRINLESEKDDFYFTIKNIDGDSLEITDLAENDVISVASDKEEKCINIIVSNEKVTGKASSYDEEIVTIAGKDYAIGLSDNGNKNFTVDLSKTGTFYIDFYGAIVGFIEDESAFLNSGYIVKKGFINPNSPNKKLELKILKGGKIEKQTDEDDNIYYTTGNSDLIIETCAENVIVNGVKKTTENIDLALPVGTVFTYTKNSDGLINKINIPKKDAVDSKRSFNPEIAAFGGAFYINEDTIVLCVPEDLNPAEDDYYTKVALDTSKKYLISAFDVDEDSLIAKYAVVTTDMDSEIGGIISKDSSIMIITKASYKIDEEMESYCEITGYQNGKEISLVVKNEDAVYTVASGLKKGDIIYYSTNSKNLVDNISLVDSLSLLDGYKVRDKAKDSEKVYGKLDAIERNKLSSVQNVKQNMFNINIAEDESADRNIVNVNVDTKKTPVIYLYNRNTHKIKVVSVDDLYSVEEVGYEKATEIYICKIKYDVKGIIAITD